MTLYKHYITAESNCYKITVKCVKGIIAMIKIMVNSDPPALALESTYDQVSTPVGLGAASGSKVAWLATSLLASSAEIKHSEPFCLVLAVEKRSPVVEMLQLWIICFHSSLVALKG